MVEQCRDCKCVICNTIVWAATLAFISKDKQWAAGVFMSGENVWQQKICMFVWLACLGVIQLYSSVFWKTLLFLSVLASVTNALLQSQQNRFCGKALVWIKSNECVLGTLDLKGTLSRMCRITVEIRCVIMIGLPFPGDKGLNGCRSSFFLDSKRNSLTFWEIVSAQ